MADASKLTVSVALDLARLIADLRRVSEALADVADRLEIGDEPEPSK